MKPHFIFNALNSIQNFILKNNVSEALDFIERFAKLTRTVLNNTETEFSTFEEELRITRHYMDIEKIRFRNFDYKVNLSHDLDASKYLVPSLILQPIVENSIWHGFQNKTEENLGLIIIFAHINNEKLELIIEDNGIGRKATMKKTAHKSIALTTLRKRIDLLNLKNTNIEFVDLYEGDRALGTKVVIRLSPNFK
jgi:LytS/YehU family sensor histidine kinase